MVQYKEGSTTNCRATNLTIGTELGEEFLVSLQYEEICDWFCIGSASYALTYHVKVREGSIPLTSSDGSNATSSVSGNVTTSVSGNATSSGVSNVTSSAESNVTSSGENNATNALVGNATSSEDGNTTSSTRTKKSYQEMGAASGDIDRSSATTTAKTGSIVTLVAVAIAANLF